MNSMKDIIVLIIKWLMEKFLPVEYRQLVEDIINELAEKEDPIQEPDKKVETKVEEPVQSGKYSITFKASKKKEFFDDNKKSLSKYLKFFEVQSKSGTNHIIWDERMGPAFDKMRELVGAPVNVTTAYGYAGGFRTVEVNTKTGGHPDSLHMEGSALDIYTSKCSMYQLAKYAQQAGFTDVWYYPGFVHVGFRHSGTVFKKGG